MLVHSILHLRVWSGERDWQDRGSIHYRVLLLPGGCLDTSFLAVHDNQEFHALLCGDMHLGNTQHVAIYDLGE